MTSEAPPRRRGRPRREGADEEILSVTLDLLREKGYRDLSVDVIAERAAVAKTTVYRRWPSKGALVAAAVAPMIAALPAPAGESRDEQVASVLRDTLPILALLRDAELDVLREALAPRRALLESLLDEMHADMLLGALLLDSERDLAAIVRAIVR